MKRWAKLWRRESPLFRAMKLLPRMLAAYLLKFTDADGRLPLGDRDAATAIALAVGADTGDRRWLRPAVEALIAHGYLAVDSGFVYVVNYPKYQHEADAKPSRTRREMNANSTRDERELDARIDLSVRNDVLAQNVLSSDKRDIEEERERNAHARVGSRSFAVGDERVTFLEAQAAFSELRQAHGGGPFRASMRDHAKVTELADFATSQGATKPERVTALKATIRGYLSRSDDWATSRGWPVSGMTDLGVCLAAGRKLATPEQKPRAPQTPRGKLRAELQELIQLHATGQFVSRPQAERIASIERREAIERELSAMEKAS